MWWVIGKKDPSQRKRGNQLALRRVYQEEQMTLFAKKKELNVTGPAYHDGNNRSF